MMWFDSINYVLRRLPATWYSFFTSSEQLKTTRLRARAVAPHHTQKSSKSILGKFNSIIAPDKHVLTSHLLVFVAEFIRLSWEFF